MKMMKNYGFQWESNSECTELMKFLIERTKDVKSPMKIIELAGEYKEKKGSSQELPYFTKRINCLLQKVYKRKTIDTATKVKIIFALSFGLSKIRMKELRKDAYVEFDEYTRIIKYRAYNGSLNLEGEHEISARARARKEARESPKAPGFFIPKARVVRTEPVPRAPEPSGTNAPLIKFLGVIQSLIRLFGISQTELTEVYQKIQQKIQNIDGIPIRNNKVTLSLQQLVALALELLVARIVIHSVSNLPKNEKFVSLKVFLCYLKAAILKSKLEGLENLSRKIEENIKKLGLNNKNIPVRQATKALQDTLNNVGF